MKRVDGENSVLEVRTPSLSKFKAAFLEDTDSEVGQSSEDEAGAMEDTPGIQRRDKAMAQKAERLQEEVK